MEQNHFIMNSCLGILTFGLEPLMSSKDMTFANLLASLGIHFLIGLKNNFTSEWLGDRKDSCESQ